MLSEKAYANAEYETLSLRLKYSTRAEHDSLEALVPLMSPTLTRNEYLQYLRFLLGLYRAIESEVVRIAPNWFDESGLNRRLPLLVSDLTALGDAPNVAEDSIHSPLPRMSSKEERLGIFYVLEGSALGAKFIRKHLQSIGIIDVDLAATFFNPYGDNMSQVWGRYKSMLDHYPPSGREADEIVASAKRMFSYFEENLRLVSRV